MFCSVVNNLFELTIVGAVTVLVNAPMVVASASHAPSPSSNEHHLNIIAWLLCIDVSLDQGDVPIVGHFLGHQTLANVVVPHESGVTV